MNKWVFQSLCFMSSNTAICNISTLELDSTSELAMCHWIDLEELRLAIDIHLKISKHVLGAKLVDVHTWVERYLTQFKAKVAGVQRLQQWSAPCMFWYLLQFACWFQKRFFLDRMFTRDDMLFLDDNLKIRFLEVERLQFNICQKKSSQEKVSYNYFNDFEVIRQKFQIFWPSVENKKWSIQRLGNSRPHA